MFTGKYKVGDIVNLKIGTRPLVKVEILECVMRSGPYYKINWEKIGFNAMLNDIAITEKVLSR